MREQRRAELVESSDESSDEFEHIIGKDLIGNDPKTRPDWDTLTETQINSIIGAIESGIQKNGGATKQPDDESVDYESVEGELVEDESVDGELVEDESNDSDYEPVADDESDDDESDDDESDGESRDDESGDDDDEFWDEKRQDVDGYWYTRSQFYDYYGGDEAWDNLDPNMYHQYRYDDQYGIWATKEEFYQHYGSNCNWKRMHPMKIMKRKAIWDTYCWSMYLPQHLRKRFIQTMLDTYE